MARTMPRSALLARLVSDGCEAFEVVAERAAAICGEHALEFVPGRMVIAWAFDVGRVDPLARLQRPSDVFRIGRDAMVGHGLLAVALRAEHLKVVGVVDASVDRVADVV